MTGAASQLTCESYRPYSSVNYQNIRRRHLSPTSLSPYSPSKSSNQSSGVTRVIWRRRLTGFDCSRAIELEPVDGECVDSVRLDVMTHGSSKAAEESKQQEYTVRPLSQCL